MDDFKPPWKKRHLPRLPPPRYRGRAWVFWTHPLSGRATGWLDASFHLRFRENLLREQERARSAFGGTWDYIVRNPVRSGLVEDWRTYPYLGSLVPGYPGIDPRSPTFFTTFWRVLNAFDERRG